MTAKPLRITHYLPTIHLADGGVAKAVLDWCKVLTDRGHEVSLICHEPADVPREWIEQKPGYPRAVVVPIAGSLFRHLRTFILSPAELEVLRKTDVLHLHAPWLMGNLRFARAARRLKIPYLISTHGMLDDWSMSQKPLKKRIYLSLVGRRFLNQSATVHCTAEAELTQANQWFDNPRTAVLPCLVDLAPFDNLPGPELGLKLLPPAMHAEQKLLFLSRLHEKKGVDVVIRATLLLRQAGMRIVLLIAGTGDPAYEKFLRELVRELGLSDAVVFLGLVTGPAKISLFQAADLFVLPTHQENFGLVLIEAMACAIPVLTTRGTDIWKEIEAAGGMIADRSPEAFAKKAKLALQNPAERIERGNRGREWVLSALAVASVSEKYESLYRSLS